MFGLDITWGLIIHLEFSSACCLNHSPAFFRHTQELAKDSADIPTSVAMDPHGDSPVDLNEDQEAALNALRSQGRIGSSSDLGSSISVLEVTTAARGQRHERNREKNRLAASKCREKSKKYVDELRERERELAAQRASLSQHAASLREEVLWLKNEILRHGDCNCEFIQNYLATAARQIT
ncbi:bZIP transcription factor [Apiospora saccharicola]|uniref:BZIP transcription factor n=1 Tax=Apiospora saccharicola TaxID=335842 RepID=A0ABR1WJI0_9PEZI